MDSQVFNIPEIEARYAGEWVLVGDPVLDEVGRVISGSVLAHDPDRDILYDEGVRLKPKRFAILCFQEPAEGTAIVL